MVVRANRVPLTKDVLEELISIENSCVESVKQKWSSRLLPYHGNKISGAIKETLNHLIGQFVTELDGIVLGYKDIKLRSHLGVIDDLGCLNCPIECNFYVFKPLVNKELPAVVTKKSKDHVGCLVYQTFNASIPKPEEALHWEGNEVEVGQEITFKVTFVKLDARIPYIKGEFPKKRAVNKRIKFEECDAPIFQSEQNEELAYEEDNDEPINPKKSRKNSDNNAQVDINVNTSLVGDEPVKKKKSRRSLESIAEIDKNMDSNVLILEPVKKRKSENSLEAKKDSSYNESEQIVSCISESGSHKKKRSRKSYEKDDICDVEDPKPKRKKKI